MKILLVVGLLALVSGCTDYKATDYKATEKIVDNLEVVTIDGCEYFKFQNYEGYVSYSHKGNCKNKIHIYAKGK